jgi:thioredoxin 2
MTAQPAEKRKQITLQCQFCNKWNRIDAARAADRPLCGSCSRPLLLDRPYPLTDDSFARTIAESDIPVFVDFYADWCGPCKTMAPSVDTIAARNQGKVLVAKMNTDYNPATARAHQIQGIPTSILFVNNAPVARESGALPLARLEAMIATAE